MTQNNSIRIYAINGRKNIKNIYLKSIISKRPLAEICRKCWFLLVTSTILIKGCQKSAESAGTSLLPAKY